MAAQTMDLRAIVASRAAGSRWSARLIFRAVLKIKASSITAMQGEKALPQKLLHQKRMLYSCQVRLTRESGACWHMNLIGKVGKVPKVHASRS